MAHDVFVSYSSTDKTVADAVVAGLEQKGIRCWIAPRDLMPGISWGQGIADAIEVSTVMVVIISENANRSKQVGREVERAISKDVAVIPFRIQNIKPTGAIAYFLSSEHWLDAISPPIERHIDKLGKAIQLFINENIKSADSEYLADKQQEVKTSSEEKVSSFWSQKSKIALIIGILVIVFICLAAVLTGIFLIIPGPTSTPTVTLTPTPSVTPTPTPTPTPTSTSTSTPTVTPTSTPTQGQALGEGLTMDNPVDGAVMVYVPEGEFLMGSEDEDAWEDEGPEHLVFLDAFWLYQTPVTNAQFAAFVQATGYLTTAEILGDSFIVDFDEDNYILVEGAYWQAPEGPDSTIVGREDHPVVHVSWSDAMDYCEWAGGRLPTEAEWEKGARGEDQRVYPWGNERPTERLANYDSFGTTPVGSFPAGASPYGALDMAGNVWEWVVDWYADDYYSRSPGANPSGPISGEKRVLRGGSYYLGISALRTYTRLWETPILPDNNIGFRCVILD